MPIQLKYKACALAMLLATSWSAQAAGLGRLNVLSGIGQPFRAEIDLVAVQPSEADSLAVSLASPEAFTNAQIAYPPTSLGLRFNIEKRASGQYYVVVTSSQTVGEPFLDLLVDLNWASGRIQREYTALIDPVGYGGSSTAGGAQESSDRFANKTLPGSISSAVKAPRVSGKGRHAKKAPAAATEESAKAPPATTNTSEGQGADSYTVKPGDTLSSIAKQVKPDGVNLEQVLVSLYKTNPDAFAGNMNRLKRGKILQIPEKEKIESVSKSEAAKEIKVQAEDWKGYRSKLAEAAGKQPAAAVEDKAASGKITAKVEDKGASQTESGKDVLKLSKGTDAKGKQGTSSQQARVNALEEEAAARQKALDEANQRVGELQKNVRDMEKTLAVKSKMGASAATGMAKASAAVAAGASAPAAQSTTAAAKVEAASAAAVASTVAAASAVASEVVAAPASAVASAPAVVASAPAKKRVAPVAPPVQEEESFLDTLLGNPLLLGGGLLAIVAGIGGLVWARRRRPANFADSIITGGDLKPNTVLGNTGGAVISTQPTENSFLTDFSRQGLGTIDTDEVDPIAEAEVYMAYGRDAQAEEILRDALVKDPGRHEVRLKLLEIYSARKDKTAFEEIAADLYAQLSGQGPIWEQAAFMGRNIDPENPLYQRKEPAGDGGDFVSTAAMAATVATTVAVAAPVAAMAGAQELDFDLGAPESVEMLETPVEPLLEAEPLDLGFTAPTAPVAEAAPAEVVDDLGFDLDDFVVPGEEAAAAPAAAPVVAAPAALESHGFVDTVPGELPVAEAHADDLDATDLDFSLDSLLEEVSSAPAPVPAPTVVEATAPAASGDIGLDFDFSLDEPAAAAPVPAPAAEVAHDLNLDDINLDLGGLEEVHAAPVPVADGEADFAADDPVQTKIDLAKAYIDMGDVEGAREILQEAISEGNATQQHEAKGLLDTL